MTEQTMKINAYNVRKREQAFEFKVRRVNNNKGFVLVRYSSGNFVGSAMANEFNECVKMIISNFDSGANLAWSANGSKFSKVAPNKFIQEKEAQNE